MTLVVFNFSNFPLSLLSWRLCHHSKGSKELFDEVHVIVAEFIDSTMDHL